MLRKTRKALKYRTEVNNNFASVFLYSMEIYIFTILEKYVVLKLSGGRGILPIIPTFYLVINGFHAVQLSRHIIPKLTFKYDIRNK